MRKPSGCRTSAPLTCSRPAARIGTLQAKICDFGLAKYTSGSMRQTYGPQKAYTLAYTSPERLQSYKRTREDDAYAFGMLLYFIVTANTPLDDIPEASLKGAVLDGVRPPIADWAEEVESTAGVPAEVVQKYCQLAEDCWTAGPELRPTFAAIHQRLAALLQALADAAAAGPSPR